MNPKYIILFLHFLFIFFSASTCKNKEAIKPIVPVDPIVDFETEILSNGVVKFLNKSKNSTDYLWDFGNNVKSTARDTSIRFNKNSKYLIKLSAKTLNGKEISKQSEILVNNLDIPKKMSFVGTIENYQVSYIDGENNLAIKNQYISCCANYEAFFDSNFGPSNKFIRMIFYVSKSEDGFDSNSNYNDIIDNIFKIGYNRIGQLTPGYAQTGI